MAVPAALGLDPKIANAGELSDLILIISLLSFSNLVWIHHYSCTFYFSGFTVHQAINDTVGSVLPNGLQRSILDGIFSIGRAQLSDSLLNEKNPLGSSRLAKLRQIFEEGKSLQLQFPAEDLGFR